MGRLEPYETELVGQWVLHEGKMIPDEVTRRIQSLVSTHLQAKATGSDGWTKLFRDPEDGRYWEMSYPHGDWHGGGPPALTCLSATEVRQRYPDWEE